MTWLQILKSHWAFLFSLTAFAAGFLALTGCRELDGDGPDAADPTVAGTYVGVGRAGGEDANVLLQLQGPDSLGRLSGAIRYDGSIITLDDANLNGSRDTLTFRYVRQNITYSAWALPGNTGMFIHFAEPAGIPEFRVNRELSDRNMTGRWQGRMYSNAWDLWRENVIMLMDQRGQLFLGQVDVAFVESAQFQLNSGTVSGDQFQLTGIMRIAATNYPAWFNGEYLAPDTISGSWQAGDPGVDGGLFEFWRSFE